MIQIDETKLTSSTIEMIGMDLGIKALPHELYFEYADRVIKELKNGN